MEKYMIRLWENICNSVAHQVVNVQILDHQNLTGIHITDFNIFSKHGWCTETRILLKEILSTMQLVSYLNLKGFKIKFDKKHPSNPNYKFWLDYISMEEILLHFIQAERDGNWVLQLESFSIILQSMTT